MKVDYLAIKFTTFMISSRTKQESFDSFGSHAPFFLFCYVLITAISISFFLYNVMSLSSIPSFLFVFQYTEIYIRLDKY